VCATASFVLVLQRLHVKLQTPSETPFSSSCFQRLFVFQLALECDDRADKAGIVKVSAEYVRVEISNPVAHPDANEELLEAMRAVLGVRLSQMSLVRGPSTRHKLLLVEGLQPDVAYERLQRAVDKT
jgi:uncharacterized protein YggU (UPF0235/DUF167 family)